LDLFSGIGGFALAAQWAGFKTVAFCEIEDFPVKVLNKNFPGVPVHRDIRELDGSEYAGVELITGGYPCQPFSVAGKRKGQEDDRHLWPEMLRIITQARPSWVVCENVYGHVSLGLDEVLADLEREGYAARSFVVPACASGADHRRDRVWILANAAGGGKQQSSAWGNVGGLQSEILRKSWNPSHFKIEPRADRVADGVPNRVDRLRGLGNAIVPQVAYQLLRCIGAV